MGRTRVKGSARSGGWRIAARVNDALYLRSCACTRCAHKRARTVACMHAHMRTVPSSGEHLTGFERFSVVACACTCAHPSRRNRTASGRSITVAACPRLGGPTSRVDQPSGDESDFSFHRCMVQNVIPIRSSSTPSPPWPLSNGSNLVYTAHRWTRWTIKCIVPLEIFESAFFSLFFF